MCEFFIVNSLMVIVEIAWFCWSGSGSLVHRIHWIHCILNIRMRCGVKSSGLRGPGVKCGRADLRILNV